MAGLLRLRDTAYFLFCVKSGKAPADLHRNALGSHGLHAYSVSEGEDKKQNDYFVILHTHTSSLLHTFSLVYTREREGVCVVEREGSVTKSNKSKKTNLTGKSKPCMYLTRAFAFLDSG